MKILRHGKEIKSLFAVRILIPENIEKNLIGKLVICSNCGLEGRLEANEEYATFDNGEDEMIYVRCPNCKKVIKVDIIPSRMKKRNILVA